MAPALREGGRSSHASQGLRSVLIVAQVSASFMLLIAAGLTLRSLMNVQSVNPGFRTENLLTLRADMSFDRIPLTHRRPERARRRSAYWTEFEERLRSAARRDRGRRRRHVPAQRDQPVPERLRARVPSGSRRARRRRRSRSASRRPTTS